MKSSAWCASSYWEFLANQTVWLRWIVGPDAVHHLYLGELRHYDRVLSCLFFHAAGPPLSIVKPCSGEYKLSYPQAKVIGVEPLVDKKKDEFQFDGGTAQSSSTDRLAH